MDRLSAGSNCLLIKHKWTFMYKFVGKPTFYRHLSTICIFCHNPKEIIRCRFVVKTPQTAIIKSYFTFPCDTSTYITVVYPHWLAEEIYIRNGQFF